MTTPIFPTQPLIQTHPLPIPAAAEASAPTLRVLALDLSITATGFALPDGQTGTFKGPWKGDWRLVAIKQAVAGHADGIDLAVIEDLPTHAKAAGITGMVHGAVRTVLMEAGVPYVLITPATLKAFATGKGNADKTAMAIAALKRAGREFPDDNQCDAAWLRWAALDWYDAPEFTVPQVQRDRLTKVTWPELAEVTR
ncbi:Holliday junction endonuclease [Streptomyces bobili]|uniref:Holliday junction endonuclease n=1 Tax=Streptomyces bobili TaxID=67280 RepID=UPI00225B9233|nr:Holliday junction endonuclease [Streptomyces bobili]MCX5522254.1 Holliday junction endonuclease [Streptomyces bobili]